MGKRTSERFDYHAANEKIAELVNGRRTAFSGMEQLIRYLEDVHPHETWDEFLKIDYRADLERICSWAENLLKRSPIKEPIRIVWFGIFNPVLRGKTTADFYLTGAESFYSDKDIDEWDWKEKYWPRGRYARSKAMSSIYRVAYQQNGLQNIAEYPLCLGYTALAAKHLCKTMPESFVCDDADRVIAAGFDSGDHLFVGTVAKRGWKRYDPKKFLAPVNSDIDDVNLFEVCDVRDGNWWLDELEGLPFSFGLACEKEESNGVVTTVHTPGQKTDFSIALMGTVVASSSLARFLKKHAGTDFQCIPARIKGHRSKHEVINVLSHLKWQSLKEWSRKKKKPISHATVEFQIMRIGEYPSRLVVAKALKDELVKRGVTGVMFRPLPEPYDWEK